MTRHAPHAPDLDEATVPTNISSVLVFQFAATGAYGSGRTSMSSAAPARSGHLSPSAVLFDPRLSGIHRPFFVRPSFWLCRRSYQLYADLEHRSVGISRIDCASLKAAGVHVRLQAPCFRRHCDGEPQAEVMLAGVIVRNARMLVQRFATLSILPLGALPRGSTDNPGSAYQKSLKPAAGFSALSDRTRLDDFPLRSRRSFTSALYGRSTSGTSSCMTLSSSLISVEIEHEFISCGVHRRV
jgi:hypothetical protein